MRIFLTAILVLSFTACQKPQEPAKDNAASAPAEPAKGVDRSHKGTHAPAIVFTDPEGEETTLASFAGRPTLVNLWASWCAPCVKELPTLDQLSRERGASLNVVAINEDNGPKASVIVFLQANRIVNLDPYQDSKMALSGALAPVLPTSILYDASGKEVWRYVGDLDWTSPEAAKLLAEAGAPQAG